MSAVNPLSLLSKSGGLAELKQRLLIVFLGILIFRLGAHVPVPGIDPALLAKFFSQQQGTVLGMFNMFTGGALSRFSVFAIGIMPYISASIIIQMFSYVSPMLMQLKKEGEQGQRKINQMTRQAALCIAAVQAYGLSRWLAGYGTAYEADLFFYFTATVSLVTGTMFLIWLGEQMTERGIGNGISIIIFSGIVVRLPAETGQMLEQVRQGQMQGLSLVIILGLIMAIVAFVVFFERGQRRIDVQYAQRTRGNKVFAAQRSHLPLKVNMSGVIPPIFATSFLAIPASLAQWMSSTSDWVGEFAAFIAPGQPLYIATFAVLVVFFAFFYTALVYNPKDTADNLKKSGAYIPGIRPGEQTAKHLDDITTRLTLFGGMYLLVVCLVPDFISSTFNIQLYYAGTSILIVVVVCLDFLSQVQSHLMSSQYESLMKKAKFKGGSDRLG